VHKLKLVLGILMIAALFVPLSQCSHDRKENTAPSPPKTGVQKVFPRNDARTDYDYGAKHFDKRVLHGDLTLVAFGWPLGFALLGWRWRSKRFGWLLCGAEILLGAGTIWFIYTMSAFFGDRLWGAWFVMLLTSAYAAAAAVDLFGSLRGSRSARAP
jgi:hypothetical protein